jgi:hypothetical protein
MGANDEMRTCGCSRVLCDDVALLVDDGGETRPFEETLEPLRSRLFLERRRSDLAEPHLVFEETVFVPSYVLQRALDRDIREELGNRPRRDRLSARRDRGGGCKDEHEQWCDAGGHSGVAEHRPSVSIGSHG